MPCKAKRNNQFVPMSPFNLSRSFVISVVAFTTDQKATTLIYDLCLGFVEIQLDSDNTSKSFLCNSSHWILVRLIAILHAALL
jgi:hypothetical protein